MVGVPCWQRRSLTVQRVLNVALPISSSPSGASSTALGVIMTECVLARLSAIARMLAYSSRARSFSPWLIPVPFSTRSRIVGSSFILSTRYSRRNDTWASPLMITFCLLLMVSSSPKAVGNETSSTLTPLCSRMVIAFLIAAIVPGPARCHIGVLTRATETSVRATSLGTSSSWRQKTSANDL